MIFFINLAQIRNQKEKKSQIGTTYFKISTDNQHFNIRHGNGFILGITIR